ncbi:MAG: chemotaxis protein CheW [Oscillospiraceae bacterium]|nr:chemotaxis protein CheW [Oscillospiraceae bacterium]
MAAELAQALRFGAEECFLAIRVGRHRYVVNLPDVDRAAIVPPTDMACVRLEPDAAAACCLLVRDQDTTFALLADEIEGIVRLRPTAQFELPKAAVCAKNRWIGGVALHDGHLVYLLDCHKIHQHFLPEVTEQ